MTFNDYMTQKNKIIIISGPTATGKTKTSISLAKKVGAEIVNFDSLVFYKELTIGTAKPTHEEIKEVPHHLVGTHSIHLPLNAADFVNAAIPIINNIHLKNKTVILVGGSGFYLQALINGMYDSPTSSEKILDQSEILYLNEGITPFLQILEKNDPESFKRYHQNDHYRIRRAVEHYWQTGTPFSSSRNKMEISSKPSPADLYHWNILHIHLDIPKDEHYKIIQNRTNHMIKNGLIEEVNDLLNQGATGHERALNSIGYKETIDFIHDMFSSKEAYIERLNINTRRLAKAQRTWFKKVEKKCYNPITDQDIILVECEHFIKSN